MVTLRIIDIGRPPTGHGILGYLLPGGLLLMENAHGYTMIYDNGDIYYSSEFPNCPPLLTRFHGRHVIRLIDDRFTIVNNVNDQIVARSEPINNHTDYAGHIGGHCQMSICDVSLDGTDFMLTVVHRWMIARLRVVGLFFAIGYLDKLTSYWLLGQTNQLLVTWTN